MDNTLIIGALGNFILSKYSNAGLGIEFDADIDAEEDEDFLTRAQMKFYLTIKANQSSRSLSTASSPLYS